MEVLRMKKYLFSDVKKELNNVGLDLFCKKLGNDYKFYVTNSSGFTKYDSFSLNDVVEKYLTIK